MSFFYCVLQKQKAIYEDYIKSNLQTLHDYYESHKTTKELLSDISWSEDEEVLSEDEYSILNDLYYLIEDVEATLSDGIYDRNLEVTYKEHFEN